MSFNALYKPAVVVLLTIGVIAVHGLYTKNELLEKYRAPADGDPLKRLQFVRKLDGSIEFSQSLVATSNLESVCSAALSATSDVSQGSVVLSVAERHEMEFYRLKYLSYAANLGMRSASVEAVAALARDSQSFVASSPQFASREKTIAELTLQALEGSDRHEEAKEYARWLRAHLAAQQQDELVRAYSARVELLASRLELTSQLLKLQSCTLQDQSLDLQELRGQVVLVEFWGTRCQPCLRELPALRRIYDKYHERGFEIIGICIGSEPERIRRFVSEHKLPWIQLCDDRTVSRDCNQRLADRFGIESLPSSLLVDKCGKVAAQGVRPLSPSPENDLESMLDQLLPH